MLDWASNWCAAHGRLAAALILVLVVLVVVLFAASQNWLPAWATSKVKSGMVAATGGRRGEAAETAKPSARDPIDALVDSINGS